MKLKKVLYNQYVISSFVAIVLLSGIFPLICSSHTPTCAKKMEKWHQKEVELGPAIDSKIKEAVVALNLLGIRTIASCEGHLDHAMAYPWIEIQTKTESIHEASSELLLVTDEIEKAHKTGKKDIEGLLVKHRELYEAFERARQQQIYPLYCLLCEFYQSRPNYDATLVIRPLDEEGHYRLSSRGAFYQDVRSDELRELKLHQYQEEMQAFTRFLTNKFLRGDFKGYAVCSG